MSEQSMIAFQFYNLFGCTVEHFHDPRVVKVRHVAGLLGGVPLCHGSTIVSLYHHPNVSHFIQSVG